MSSESDLTGSVLPIEAMIKRRGRASVEEFAGMPEHPDDTLERLQADGIWEQFGKALYEQEIKRAKANKNVKPTEIRRAAWTELQRTWPPPIDAVPVPTLLELRRFDQERAKVLQGRRAEKEEAKGTKPPRLTAEEKERFRNIDAEMASGQRRIDSLEEVHWVFQHIDDEDVTAMDAPSRGAWTNLFYARHNRVKFLDSTWPAASKELQKRQQTRKIGTVSENEQKCRDEIRAMIRQAVKHSREIEADDAI